MKVTAFNGSPRTSILIGHLFEALEEEGIKTMQSLGGFGLAAKADRQIIHHCNQVSVYFRRDLRGF